MRFTDLIDTTHIAMIIPKKFYLKIAMPHGRKHVT